MWLLYCCTLAKMIGRWLLAQQFASWVVFTCSLSIIRTQCFSLWTATLTSQVLYSKDERWISCDVWWICRNRLPKRRSLGLSASCTSVMFASSVLAATARCLSSQNRRWHFYGTFEKLWVETLDIISCVVGKKEIGIKQKELKKTSWFKIVNLN